MPFMTVAKQDAAAAIAAAITKVSLHALSSGDPGTTGAGELTGGSPAYARQTPAFSTSGGIGTLSSSLSFNVLGPVTITHVGLWKGTTWYGWRPLATPRTIGSVQDVVLLSSLTVDLTTDL